MVAPQINAGLAVASEASLSVSQTKRCFVRGANTEMKIYGKIAGDLATGQKKLTARQWAVLIGFCGVETLKQVQNFGRESKRIMMQQRCAPLWSFQSRNNNLKLTDSPSGCGLETMLRKTSVMLMSTAKIGRAS